MERINTADKRFSDGTAAAGYLDGTVVIAKWLNDVQEEVSSFIEALGLVLDGAKQDQLATAIKTLMQKQTPVYAVDTGAANAYTTAFSPAIVAVNDGMRVRIKVNATNTGASTFAPNAIAAKPIWGGNHQPLQGGEMFAGGFADLEWNAALNAGAGVWLLVGCTGGARQTAPGTQSGHAPALSQFSAVLAGTGSLKIPVMVSGVLRTIIINWGQIGSVNSGTHAAVTFATAFPNACLRTFATLHATQDSTTAYTVGSDAGTLTGMNIYSLAGSTATINWMAIGW